jgi:hypothetical protein
MEGTESTTTSIEFAVNAQKRNTAGELIDTIAASGKLTKADAGRAGYNSEEWLTISVEPGETDLAQPKVTVNSHSKLTKADAGRTDTTS